MVKEFNTGEEFEKLVRANKRIFRSKDPKIRQYLLGVKAKAKIDNAGLTPYVGEQNYKCLTCGTVNKSHPETSYCFVCNTDNWHLPEGGNS